MKRQMPAKILFLSGHLLYLGPWNHLKRPKGSWNRASGSIWNARSALGTPLGSWNRASGSIWNAAGFWPALQRLSVSR